MKKMRHNKDAIKKAVELYGSVASLAEEIGVSYQSVLNWRSGKIVPTAVNCVAIEKAVKGKISRKEILPNFPWDELSGQTKEEEN